MLLNPYAPASVAITRRYEILLFSEPRDRDLTQSPGPSTQDLLARVREGLPTRLRGLVHKAIEDGQPETVTGLRLRRYGAGHRVRVTFDPLGSPETEDCCWSPSRTTTSAPGLARQRGVERAGRSPGAAAGIGAEGVQGGAQGRQ